MSDETKVKRGYSYKDLAERTPFSARFWRREVALGRIPVVKFDQRVMILHEDLENYLAERRQLKNGQEKARNQAVIVEATV